MAAFTPEELQKKAEKGGSGSNGGGAALGIVGMSGGNSATKPTTKVIKSPHQLSVLQDYFYVYPIPCRQKKVELGFELGLTPRQIQQWFCDERSKRNKKMKEPSAMNLSHTNGALPVVDAEKKMKMIDGANKHAADASSTPSPRSLNSGCSGSRSTRIILKPRAAPSVKDEQMTTAAQWDKMPSLNHCEDTLGLSGHKRKMPSLSSAAKRVRREDEGLSKEAHQMFRELRREALRSREKEWSNPSSVDFIHQQRQQPSVGVPSPSSSVGYGYCAETDRCFIIRRPNPAMFSPRPVSQEKDISKTANNPKTEQAAVEEERIRRKLQIRDIRREKRREMESALKECLALLPCH